MTVTGTLPSPLPPMTSPSEPAVQDTPDAPTPQQAERQSIVQDLLRWVRYLLTLKARPPFHLAGIEMVERLTVLKTILDKLIQHYAEPQLVQLRQGLHNGLQTVHQDYSNLRQAADWLSQIESLLDPDKFPGRKGDEVRSALFDYLDQIKDKTQNVPNLRPFYTKIRAVSDSYDKGLFFTYDLPALPRTNNDRESEFRDINRRLLATTGQQGLVRRLVQREGAWECISRPDSLQATQLAISQVSPTDLRQEQRRIRSHRQRFRLHVRSVNQSNAQLQRLVERWTVLPTSDDP